MTQLSNLPNAIHPNAKMLEQAGSLAASELQSGSEEMPLLFHQAAQWVADHQEQQPYPDLILLLDRYGVCREYWTEHVFEPNGSAKVYVGHTLAEIFGIPQAHELHRLNRQLFATQQTQFGHFSFAVGKRQLHLDVRFTYAGPNRALVVLRDLATSMHTGIEAQPPNRPDSTQVADHPKVGQNRANPLPHIYHKILDLIPCGLILVDPLAPDRPIIYANAGFERLTGYTGQEVYGRNCRFLQGQETDSATIKRLRQAIQQQESCMVELINYRKDGTPFWNALLLSPLFDEHGTITYYLGVQTDITTFKSMEQQVQQAQKMESVGRLTGGVAHDFNNILTIINSYCDLILHYSIEPTIQRQICQIQGVSKKGAALTQQLLSFSRQQQVKPVVLELNQVVFNLQKMMTRLIGEHIQIQLELAPEPLYVKLDAVQFEQVLMNLAVNARDAMPKGGTLTIHLQSVALTPANFHASAQQSQYTIVPERLPTGFYAQISVADTGEGMSAATKARIFEPFFTTKAVGKGTGLGLATVQGILLQNRGFIDVESEVGQGTVFHLWLPQTDEALSSPTQVPMIANELNGGNERLLVVEDEDQIRALTTLILEEKGYTVFAAANAAEAIHLAATVTEPLDLLVTDMIMPGINGVELYTKLAAKQPTLKVLFVSGYIELEMPTEHLTGYNDFLQKPFTLELLVSKVRELLDRP